MTYITIPMTIMTPGNRFCGAFLNPTRAMMVPGTVIGEEGLQEVFSKK
jgi:hypothetical protein